MSQSILDFGLASSAARNATRRHQKNRQQQENDHSISQLHSQNQLRSQRKARYRRQNLHDIVMQCQNQPATPQNLPQTTVQGLNSTIRIVLSDDDLQPGIIGFPDPTIKRPTFDVYDTHTYTHTHTHTHTDTHTHTHTHTDTHTQTQTRKKQSLGAFNRILRKNEMSRFRSERVTVEDLYLDLVSKIRSVEETFLHGPISDELQEHLDDMFDTLMTHVLEAHQPQVRDGRVESPLCRAIREGDPKAINKQIRLMINNHCTHLLQGDYSYDTGEDDENQLD